MKALLLLLPINCYAVDCVFSWTYNDQTTKFNLYKNRQLIESNLTGLQHVRQCEPGIYELRAVNKFNIQSDYSERALISVDDLRLKWDF